MRLRHILFLAVPGLWALPALAAEAAGKSGPSESIFVAQVLCLLIVGRLLGEVMQRIGQPGVVGQLLAGILLGPSFFGLLLPGAQHAIFPSGEGQKAMLEGVAQLGVLLLLLLTGMETDIGLVRRVRKAAASVSIAGVAVPFACGFALGQVLPAAMLPHPELRTIASLFLGTALSISSVKIVAMVVREMGFLRRNLGQVIVASAIIDDTIGWVIIAITFSLALHGSFDVWSLSESLLGTALFLGVSFTLGRRIVFLLIRWANDQLVSEAAVITTILAVMGLMALATHAIGVHTVLGAFVAGILVGQSPILTGQIDRQLRGVVTALFAPVFFGLAGLSADLTILADPSLLGLTIGLIAIASLGKFAGAFIGGTLGGLKRAECVALACGMNARGSTEVIVATIGLSIGALSQNLFTMIVAMAILTTLAMPPMLRWALGRLPMDEEERKRLEREAFEARGFVSNLERLLVAADDTPETRFALRLAGLMAGIRGMAATVIHLDVQPRPAQLAKQPGVLEGLLRQTAQAAQTRIAGMHGDTPDAVEVVEREAVGPVEDAALSEAQKGYDLLVVGFKPQENGSGSKPGTMALLDDFPGPLAIVAGRGEHLSAPDDAPLSILVAVNGTEVSRRGAEVALTLARASGAPITALYVSNRASRPRRRRLLGLSKQRDEAVLRDVAVMADRVGVPIRTAVRVRLATEDAILRQARLGRHNLIVMGVTRRPGDGLAMGDAADALLDRSDRSLLFLAS